MNSDFGLTSWNYLLSTLYKIIDFLLYEVTRHCEFEGYIGWKKSLNILGHSPEKLKYVPLKLAQMEMFSLGKSEKYFKLKSFFSKGS